jgi:energy-coupling factor transporter ATP-binding protein EcfA2
MSKRQQFSVVPPSRRAPNDPKLNSFVLVQDNWNDFSFQTQYQLYVKSKSSAHELIGSVKILKKGQTSSEAWQIKQDFTKLGSEFASLGQSLDYYQRIGELPAESRNQILSALRDVVYKPELESEFVTEPGWKISVLRDFENDPHFRTLAQSFLSGNFTELASLDDGFTFQIPGWLEPITFRFVAPAIGQKVGGFFLPATSTILPDRITVIIGKNGSGKSTLLARIARVAFASVKDRDSATLAELGRLEPPGVGFSRIVTVSYSAFDSFQIPGVNAKERDQIARDVKQGDGRFVFCGLRDIAAELAQEVGDGPLRVDTQGVSEHGDKDRVRYTLLKPIEGLAAEFAATLSRIERLNRTSFFTVILDSLLADSSFNDARPVFAAQLLGDASQAYLGLSTGHKIVIQVIANLTAYTLPRSLILFDEPEMHLHPPLLAALMHAIRKILKKWDALAVIATHSPVVLQETLAQNVFVVRREGGISAANVPTLESFGENVGTLTEFIFGLDSDSTDFHAALKRIVNEQPNLEAIEEIFKPHGLSMQARAFVMGLLSRHETDS